MHSTLRARFTFKRLLLMMFGVAMFPFPVVDRALDWKRRSHRTMTRSFSYKESLTDSRINLRTLTGAEHTTVYANTYLMYMPIRCVTPLLRMRKSC